MLTVGEGVADMRGKGTVDVMNVLGGRVVTVGDSAPVPRLLTLPEGLGSLQTSGGTDSPRATSRLPSLHGHDCGAGIAPFQIESRSPSCPVLAHARSFDVM